MTKVEHRILSPLARSLILDCASDWEELKYQTQFGPEAAEFPYYPAALEFQKPAREAIAALDAKDKSSLLESWRSKSRHPHEFDEDQRILTQYAVILVDLIIKRAKQAGSRTQNW